MIPQIKVSDNNLSRSTFSIEEDDEFKEFDIDFDMPDPSSYYDAKRGEKRKCWAFASCVAFASSNMSFILGQILSVALAANGAASEAFHLSFNGSVPTLQTFLMYFLMALIHLPYWCHKTYEIEIQPPKNLACQDGSQENPHAMLTNQGKHRFINIAALKLHSRSWKYYALLAFLHVEANFCLLKAYEYVSLKTVSLLDSLTIPAAILTSRLLLGRRYTCTHIFAATICILGSFLMVANDYRTDEKQLENNTGDVIFNTTSVSYTDNGSRGLLPVAPSSGILYPHSLLGDAFAIAGAILTGLNDVLAEEVVQETGSCVEYLAMLGFFGTIISFLQAIALEWTGIQNLFIYGGCIQWLFLLTSSLAGYIFFGGMSRFLLMSESALLNLSLLSGDLWAVIFSVLEEHVMPSYVFYISFCVIVSGVAIYEMGPSPIVEHDTQQETKRLRTTSPTASESDDDERSFTIT